MKKDREFYKKRAEDLANDNIRLITDNVSLKIENKELKEQSKLFGVVRQSGQLKEKEIQTFFNWVKKYYKRGVMSNEFRHKETKELVYESSLLEKYKEEFKL